MNDVLMSSDTLFIDKELAKTVGLNNAIFIQMMNKLSGGNWVKITYPELQEKLPFWSEPTIMRRVKFATENGYLDVKYAGKNDIDRTNSYKSK